MAISKNLTVLAAALVGGSAFAADATFDNHLQSTSIVSPAQLYQVRDLKTDFALGFGSRKGTIDTDAGKSTSTTADTQFFAAGVYNAKAIGLRAGLSADFLTGDSERKDVDVTVNADTASMTVTPQAAYSIGPVVVGAAFDITQKTEKKEGTEEAKASYSTFRPGVLFQNDQMEAGLTYSSPHNAPADEEKDLDVVEPAVVTVHGRYALDNNLALGALVGNKHYTPIGKINGTETLKDQMTLTATSEYTAGAIKVEGDLGYNSAYYKGSEHIDRDNISTIKIGAGADYAVNKDAAVGGAVNYKFGSDSANGSDYAVNDLGFAIRGNVKF